MKRSYKIAAATWMTVAMGMSIAVYAGKGPHMVVDKFKMMDADRNSRLSPQEYAAGSAKMFNESDLNKDGTLTAEEMDAHRTEKMKKHDRKMKGHHEDHDRMTSQEKIAKLDGNGDGALTKAEHETGSAKKFSEMDTDKDGFLTLNEMQAAHEKMMGNPAKQ